MKKMITLSCAITVCLLTACGDIPASGDRPPHTLSQEDTAVVIEELGETESAENPEHTAYKEYLTSLQYLDQIELKLSEAITTVDMVSAINEALEGWDYELNKIYGLLLERLSSTQIEELRAIQREWIKERDSRR